MTDDFDKQFEEMPEDQHEIFKRHVDDFVERHSDQLFSKDEAFMARMMSIIAANPNGFNKAEGDMEGIDIEIDDFI